MTWKVAKMQGGSETQKHSENAKKDGPGKKRGRRQRGFKKLEKQSSELILGSTAEQLHHGTP
jgi:hypothetical protein